MTGKCKLCAVRSKVAENTSEVSWVEQNILLQELLELQQGKVIGHFWIIETTQQKDRVHEIWDTTFLRVLDSSASISSYYNGIKAGLWYEHFLSIGLCSFSWYPIVRANCHGGKWNKLYGINNVLKGSDQRSVANFIEHVKDNKTKEPGIQKMYDNPEYSAIEESLCYNLYCLFIRI